MKKPNDKSSALRFLLLRYIFSYKDSVNLKTFNEVNDTLKVILTDGNFLITWMNNNIEQKAVYKENDFNFFVRGDITSKNNNIKTDLNHINATNFSKRALLTNKDNKYKKNEFLYTVNDLAILIIPFPFLLMFLNYDYLYFAATLVMMIYLGFFKISDFLQPLIFLLLVFIDYFYTGLTLSFIFFILVILDPNKYLFKIRLIISSLSVFFLVSYLFTMSPDINFKVDIFLYIFLSVLIFIPITFIGNHFNKTFLLLPFTSLGLYLDADKILVIFIIIFSIIMLISLRYGYLIFPKQKQNKLTPNG